MYSNTMYNREVNVGLEKGGAWKVCGKCVEGAWKVCGRRTDGVWKVRGRFVELSHTAPAP